MKVIDIDGDEGVEYMLQLSAAEADQILRDHCMEQARRLGILAGGSPGTSDYHVDDDPKTGDCDVVSWSVRVRLRH